MTLLALIFFTTPVVQAEDAAATEAVDEAQAIKDREAANQLAKEERRKAAKQKKRTMESCLTLTRSFYGA